MKLLSLVTAAALALGAVADPVLSARSPDTTTAVAATNCPNGWTQYAWDLSAPYIEGGTYKIYVQFSYRSTGDVAFEEYYSDCVTEGLYKAFNLTQNTYSSAVFTAWDADGNFVSEDSNNGSGYHFVTVGDCELTTIEHTYVVDTATDDGEGEAQKRSL